MRSDSSVNRPTCTCVGGTGTVFEVSVIDERAGLTVLQVTGKSARILFMGESGGHRWQTVPPHEKRGRVHTSTITVAVLPVPERVQVNIKPEDLEFMTTRGSGAGGQHRNKTDSAVIVRHIPTKMMVRCETSRSQHQNKYSALELLATRLLAQQKTGVHAGYNNIRRDQIGSGERGDKIRTIRFQDNIVIDHASGQKWDLSAYLKGDWPTAK
jgi:peptide chain release factor 1